MCVNVLVSKVELHIHINMGQVLLSLFFVYFNFIGRFTWVHQLVHLWFVLLASLLRGLPFPVNEEIPDLLALLRGGQLRVPSVQSLQMEWTVHVVWLV